MRPYRLAYLLLADVCAYHDGTGGDVHQLMLRLVAYGFSYNDWGGASAYEGVRKGNLAAASDPETGMEIPFPQLMRGSHHLSFHRPISPGFISTHPDVPRAAIPEQMPPRGTAAYDAFRKRYRERRQHADGLTTFYFATGWAMYERHFALWAQRNGYVVHFATNLDLHQQGENLLNGYRCAVSVGHDEYWSAAMRNAADAFVASGGQWARFAGNFMWQIRIEEDTEWKADKEQKATEKRWHQVCYKYDYTADPVYGRASRMSDYLFRLIVSTGLIE